MGSFAMVSGPKNIAVCSDLESEEMLKSDLQIQKALAEKKIKPGLYQVLPTISKRVVNNIDGLNHSLTEIKLTLPWIERLDLDSDLAPVAPELSAQLEQDDGDDGDIAQDDFKREVSFYRQAQGAVIEGIERLRSLNVPTKRPEDYFAQMLKTDEHMQKVRESLVNKQLILERREKVRKLRELKKYGKQVQTKVLIQRAKAKKETMDIIKKIRKGQKDKLEFLGLDKNVSDTRKKQNTKVNQHRKIKDEKYGYGGKKKRSKSNDAMSYLQFDKDFSKSGRMPRGKRVSPKKKNFGKHNKGKRK